MVAKAPPMLECILLTDNGRWAPSKVQTKDGRLPDAIEIRQPLGPPVRLEYLAKFGFSGLKHPIAFYIHDKIPLDILWDEPKEEKKPGIWTPDKEGLL